MALGKITIVTLLTQISATVTMITIAWFHPSVWAIVIGGLVGSFVTMAASHFLIPGRHNRLAWDRAALRELFGPFAVWILVSTLITFFANESDRLMLGKLVPLEVLGVYYLAQTLVRLPTEMISRLAGMTVFPALAHAANQAPRVLRDRFFKARALILPAGVAATLGLMMGAPIFFGVLYRRNWSDAGWMAQLLAIGVWATILQLTADRTLLALGHTRPLAISNAANVIVTVIGAFTGRYLGDRFFHGQGMPGFILGVVAGNFAGHLVIQIALAGQGLGIHWQDLKFTALLVLLASVGLGLPRLAPVRLHTGASILCVSVVLTGTSAWAGWRVWRWMKPRRAGAQGLT
jgi:hypothetical protein